MTIAANSRSLRITYSVFSFLLVAANLRPALTNVGPLLGAIRGSLGLSITAAGFLTALPLPIFACFAPFVRLGFTLGIERILAGCLALVAAGVALRSQGSVVALFAGTAVFAVGIGIANMLMPSLIKRDFPHHIGSTITAYVMVMSLASAIATGLSVPLSVYFGWQASLAIWAVPAALTLVCWLPEARKPAEKVAQSTGCEDTGGPVWRSVLAWQVTLFMGLQFLIFYVTVGWMPLFLADQGIAPAEAGRLLTLFQIVSFGAGFVTPALLRRQNDQRAIAVVPCVVTAIAISGLLFAPRLAVAWLSIFGASFGISFILAFAFIGMRARDHRRAASLSTLSQSVAYLIAAAGPPAFGWQHDLTRHWTVPMASLVAVALMQAVAGLGAGRNRYV